MIKSFWRRLGRTGRIGWIAGVVVIVALTALVGYWALRTQYEVLFADLTAQDAAAMTAELERQKIPFTVSDHDSRGGATILVDRNDVYKTRIKLMGRDLPLHGAVGFELFNNSDFGMTEFAQKVNYQRALQGELTRTILSLSEVRDARVLLALPDQGLFKQPAAKPKASITLSLRQGQTLRPEQVTGIQRLVAAAVAGIAVEDVTIVDQLGVALTRAGGDGPAEGGSSRLDLKKDTETYLSRKASDVLERALGPSQALATVDVTLNLDRVQTTTEDVVAAPGKPGRVQTGVVVREREAVREVGTPLSVRATAEPGGGPVGGSSQREVEYAVGRRVEQVISHPGSIRRIQVVAVVKRALDASLRDQISKMVAASVGASVERGDTVVVQSMESINAAPKATGAASRPLADAKSSSAPAASDSGHASTPDVRPAAWAVSPVQAAVALSVGLATVAVAIWLARRVRHPEPRSGPGPSSAAQPLSDAQRQAALAQLQDWLRSGDGGRASGGAS